MMGMEKGRFLTGPSKSGGEPAVSSSLGFCCSHQVMLTMCVTEASQVALRRGAKL